MQRIGEFDNTIPQEDLIAATTSLNLINNDAAIIMQHELEKWVGAGVHCTLTKSGTQALTLALRALDIGPGDIVATSPWTFIATLSAITNVGATPLLVDVDQKTWTMSANALEKALTANSNVKAIIPVDLFGVPADLQSISAVAKNIPIIVDACQSFGAEVNGVKVGALPQATMTAVSLYPTKPMGGYGEGGAVFTQDTKLYTKLMSIANHGAMQTNNGLRCVMSGDNCRSDALLSALYIQKLKRADQALNKRRQILQVYKQELPNVKFQEIPKGILPAVHLVQVLVNKDLEEKLTKVLVVRKLLSRTVIEDPLYTHSAQNTKIANILARSTIGLSAYPSIDIDQLRQVLQNL